MKKSILLILALLLTWQISDGRQPQRGYRGFLEWSSSLRSDNRTFTDLYGNFFGKPETAFYTGVTTSHGYQINPMFFVGAGIGMERCGKFDNWVAPIFIEGRADLQFGRFTPFADLRLGANMAEGAGIYFSPSVGYRFNWGRKMGVNLSAGLTLAGYKVDIYEGTWEGPDSYDFYYVTTKHQLRPYFSFRLGIDF